MRQMRSIYAIQMDQAERVLALYRETYLDLNGRHFTRSCKRITASS